MTRRGGGAASRLALGRRAALTLPIGLAGCGLFDEWFGDTKAPMPGKREAVIAGQRGLSPEAGVTKVVVPPPVANTSWPQAGGDPTHLMGHLAAQEQLRRAWNVSIGKGGGYRAKLLAQPVVADGVVYAMDSQAAVSAFDLASGIRRWHADTKDKTDHSTNVGGGLAVEGNTLYAVNGLAELVAFDKASGRTLWRRTIAAPARSVPLLVEGKLFLVTIDDRLLALAADDGRQLWTHSAAGSGPGMLGQPAPAYADGLVVAGFASGEIAALRVDTGDAAWTDSVASAREQGGLTDISSIRGLPVIADGRVYVIGLGGLLLTIDLRSGRRLWERNVAGEDSPWIAGDWLFVISTEQQLAAVRRQDGRVAWVINLPRWKNPKKQQDAILWFGPVLAGNRLIAVGTDAEMLSLRPETGEVTLRQKLDGPAALGPVVAGGTVLIVTDDGRLLAFR
ncbi:MAG: PQQ-binding-like beta-propeller repeat protein [Alphaproteobacteria bacterium]|nr:PQQ-binding-like beta-propeller repeat protein [Alphaproteobacteria bacterium]